LTLLKKMIPYSPFFLPFTRCEKNQPMNYIYKFLFFLTLFFLLTDVSGNNAIGAEQDRKDSGLMSISPKIIGGTTAAPDAWPWMVALVRPGSTDYYYGQFCGGTLIAEKWVLTAAHCVYNKNLNAWDDPEKVEVVMELHNLKNDAGDKIPVKRIVGHPDYNPVTFNSDLALLELEWASSAQILSLFSDTTDDLSGAAGTLIGWGDTSPSSSPVYPEELQQVVVPVVANTICNGVYSGLVTENMICAGYGDGGKDSCVGDSGGPLVVLHDNQWSQAGIISWANGCALPQAYGVNTRISRFIRFIDAYVDPQSRISVSPSTVWFGYVPLGGARQINVEINNNGSKDLVIGNIGHVDILEPPFAISSDTCTNKTLAPAEQCDLVIDYGPEVLQDYHASFDIPSNDPTDGSFIVYVTARKHFPWRIFAPAIINLGSKP